VGLVNRISIKIEEEGDKSVVEIDCHFDIIMKEDRPKNGKTWLLNRLLSGGTVKSSSQDCIGQSTENMGISMPVLKNHNNANQCVAGDEHEANGGEKKHGVVCTPCYNKILNNEKKQEISGSLLKTESTSQRLKDYDEITALCNGKKIKKGRSRSLSKLMGRIKETSFLTVTRGPKENKVQKEVVMDDCIVQLNEQDKTIHVQRDNFQEDKCKATYKKKLLTHFLPVSKTVESDELLNTDNNESAADEVFESNVQIIPSQLEKVTVQKMDAVENLKLMIKEGRDEGTPVETECKLLNLIYHHLCPSPEERAMSSENPTPDKKNLLGDIKLLIQEEDQHMKNMKVVLEGFEKSFMVEIDG